jgi:hypothetical protein
MNDCIRNEKETRHENIQGLSNSIDSEATPIKSYLYRLIIQFWTKSNIVTTENRNILWVKT